MPGLDGRLDGGVVVGSFQLETHTHTALLILFIFGDAMWLAGS